MNENDKIGGVFRQIEKALGTTKKQAAKAALTSVRAEYAKRVKEETGIPSALLKKRAKNFLSDSNATLSIGTRIPFKASVFSPMVKAVRSRLGRRWTATIKIGKFGRMMLDGAFVILGKNSGKPLVVQRTGTAKLPIKEVIVGIFAETVEAIKPELGEKFRSAFLKNYDSKAAFNLSKIKSD